MTKKIVKRTDANNETLYFYTHSDAVDVGDGNATISLTNALNNKANTSDVQALSDDALRKSSQILSNQEKEQVHNNLSTESFIDDRAVRYDEPQVLGSDEKAQALTNLGLNGVDEYPTKNSTNMVRSSGVAEAIDDVQYARFDGIQETSVTLNTTTTATGNGAVLFYVPDNRFIYKVSTSYYTLWNNVNKFTNGFYNNDAATPKALTTKIFINTINGLSYSFDGANFSTVAIDDVPTPNSDNLVKSGGVYEEINQLDEKTEDNKQAIDGIPPVNISGVIPVVAGTTNQRSSGAKCIINIPSGTYLFQMDDSFFGTICQVNVRINNREVFIGNLASINNKNVTLAGDATEIYIYSNAASSIKTGDCAFSLSQDGVPGVKDDIADLKRKRKR